MACSFFCSDAHVYFSKLVLKQLIVVFRLVLRFEYDVLFDAERRQSIILTGRAAQLLAERVNFNRHNIDDS